jgi:hypothetical protein
MYANARTPPRPIVYVALVRSKLMRISDGGRGGPDYRTGFYRQDEAKLAATSVQAPEIDPASWVAALTLLGGGLIVMRGRRTKDPLA